jgi:CO/xanthine dehydrogenase FAD-binding subunit
VNVHRPQNLDEALELMADASQPITPIAGGTDLLVSWHHRPHDSITMLDLSPLRELTSMRMTNDHLELGALTTYWDVISSNGTIAPEFPLLVQAARVVGAIQIQTRGTWAGNIANGSPAADGVPVLMAYDAAVVLQSREGSVEVPLDQYYTGYRTSVRRPDQLIVGIKLPRRPREKQWFYKVGARAAQAIAKVGVATVKDAGGWRVIASSVAPVIKRCRALESALDQGRSFSDPSEIADLLQSDVSPIDDIRSTASYREAVLSRLLFYALRELDGNNH